MEDWTIVMSTTLPQNAYIAKSLLESEGIKVVLKDELTVQVNNFYSNAIGGVKLLIRKENYKQAIDLLENAGYVVSYEDWQDHQPELIQKKSNVDKTICPYCTSHNISQLRDPNLLSVLVFYLLGIFFPLFKRTYICYDCDKKWKYVRRKRK